MKVKAVPTERFSRLDIIDDHDLRCEIADGYLKAFCSCQQFIKERPMNGPWTLEAIKDQFLKHVQKVRDELRGGQHV